MELVVELVEGAHSADNRLDCSAGINDGMRFLGGFAPECEHCSTEEAHGSTALLHGYGWEWGRGGGAISIFLHQEGEREIWLWWLWP